ncbi:hypothetical protein [Lewinella sp. IMCC34191]|uniref:hypothetical protein n=1 Tax=Lewinella sp. IMCC34191 TaxID=2259172 RepID=UPI000E2872B7|nr:hypothetical protein [Lewinella sp. IMCC34191]
MNAALSKLYLEFRKLKISLLVFICIGFSAVPFLITEVFLYFYRDELMGQPLAVITGNNVGSWSALLYPLFIIVLAQSIVEVERKGNLLHYARSYRRHWMGLITRKALVIFSLLLTVTFLNIAFHALLIYSLKERMVAGDVSELMRADSQDFIRITVALIPLVFFHLMLALLIQKSGIGYLVGMLLLVTGIPIINLTDLPINPYSFGIASLKPGLGLHSIVLPGAVVILLSLVVADWGLKR